MKTLISDKFYGIVLTIFGLIGLAATSMIFIEKARIAVDENYKAICTINETFSCNDVMASWQSATFGFPNTHIGFVGFAITIIIGLLYIFSKKPLPKFVLIGNLVGFSLAMMFVFWLAHAAIFDIRALCIYCMIIWFAIINLLITTVSKITKFPHWQNLTLISLATALFAGVIWYEIL